MKVIDQSIEILSNIKEDDVLKLLEIAGRTCYKSENQITEDTTSAKKLIGNIMKSNHLSVIEHYNITVKIISNIGITREIARHRHTSLSQESTRYCNYCKEKFNGELIFIKPYNYEGNEEVWNKYFKDIEDNYTDLINKGMKPEIARDILPLGLKSELVITTNLREWKSIIELRSTKFAHPQIRELMILLTKEFNKVLPFFFELIKE